MEQFENSCRLCRVLWAHTWPDCRAAVTVLTQFPHSLAVQDQVIRNLELVMGIIALDSQANITFIAVQFLVKMNQVKNYCPRLVSTNQRA